MKIFLTESFRRDYKKLPGAIQRIVDKQLFLLLENIKHPSLRVKKMAGHPEVWESRISKGYRFTFQITKGTYIIRRAGTHAILQKP